MKRSGARAFSAIYLMVLSCILAASVNQHAYCKSNQKVRQMVAEMLAGRHSQTQIQYLTKTYGSFSIDQAYEIQAALAKQLRKDLGCIAGYKVAFASKAAQEQFGVDEPASGVLFRLQRVPSGSRLPAGAFMELLVETEIAFTIGKRIEQTVKDITELKRSVKWVHAAFDIGDSRFAPADTKPTVQDMVASDVGAHFFVLGPAMDPGEMDVDALILKLAVNGRSVAQSPATNVMGSPWNSLLWLANHVIKLGGKLEPGDVVVTGTAAPAYSAKGPQMKGFYEGDCGPLGKVTLTIY